MLESAEEILGKITPSKHKQSHDNVIEELSNQQKEIRIQINNSSVPKKIQELKCKRNNNLREIKSIQSQNRTKEIDAATDEINKAKNQHNSPQTKTKNIVTDKEGKIPYPPE